MTNCKEQMIACVKVEGIIKFSHANNSQLIRIHLFFLKKLVCTLKCLSLITLVYLPGSKIGGKGRSPGKRVHSYDMN